FLVHRLTDARQQVAPDVAFAVEAGDVLVELALLVAIPRVLGGEAFQDEDVAELPPEVVALVLGGRLVVPVRRVALGRVDRFGHADDLVDLGPVGRPRRDAPRRFDGDGGAGVAGDAAGLLGRRTGDDADHVLGADLRRIVVAIVDRQRRQVAGVAAGDGHGGRGGAGHVAAGDQQRI